MKAIEILYNLSPYQNLLDEIFLRENKQDENFVWMKSLKSQYSFITLEVRVTPVDEQESFGELVVQVVFEIINNKVVLSSIYCEEDSRREELERWIKTNTAVHDVQWHTEPDNTWYHDAITTAYINIADAIAKEAYHCNPGDDYRPGFFSEIEIKDTLLSLSQINLHNSRSIDHKDDYHMRKLHFYIPLSTSKIETTLEMNYQIGEMAIAFSDHSSMKNRGCGQKIVEQILHQKISFEKTKE